ncbi:hypothetical protein ACFQ09_02080 [Massilia norwichensis]|jgi:energy-converting hydrogenase Eha subunit E|uniref:Uncharacterized protein n=1 Tax=Massilia norwichensis TaxID=1442366 RepID=A0ABT2A7X8_9BURK|nr:hypothetical protein [Massilia norwichensis]MCS0590272.1 hypothetical protein [Massilia norwichensis]
MENIAYGIAAIGVCLLVVAWQEFRSRNHRDGRLMAGAGALIVIGSAAASIFTSA